MVCEQLVRIIFAEQGPDVTAPLRSLEQGDPHQAGMTAHQIEQGVELPVIGTALSFPASDTVDGVDYRVNRVWDMTMEEDATYEDAAEDEG